ncbi:hypothetical protein Pla108_41990 [Botrimarina colliarenosi]|uniref:Uncharacterized protein n=1 Tax=Botrimarina colliarenosi TaxID=2528001 RepID=A0A5C5ZX25_9BACT|nr:hypothetical protein Pla108_41990 [Botrimarina colliarenosi]
MGAYENGVNKANNAHKQGQTPDYNKMTPQERDAAKAQMDKLQGKK